jgi:hypothetical protein
MREFVLLLIGFFLAFCIFRYRYAAANDISELILCLEKIDAKGIFNYDPSIEIAKNLQSLDLRFPNFEADLSSAIFNSPAVVASGLYNRGLGIQRFLDQGYFPLSAYFRANRELLYEFLRNCDHPDSKAKFVTDYILRNARIGEMAENLEYTGEWSESQSGEQKKRNELESLFKSLDESQLQGVAFAFISEAKKELISLIESIKPKYITSRSLYGVKRACFVFVVLLSLQALFHFAWGIDLLDIAAVLLTAFLEPSDY